MVGLLQIMIYLFCVYLVYKGFEIFQIAFVSPNSKNRNVGIVIGIISICVAAFIGVAAVLMTESIVESIGKNMQNLPGGSKF